MGRSTNLVVKLATGIEDAERVAQAFSVASTALASGIKVSFWLAGEASWLALPGRAEQFTLAKSAPLDQLLAALIKDARVTLCTQCAARRSIEESDLIPGIRIAGSSTFVEEITSESTQALVY